MVREWLERSISPVQRQSFVISFTAFLASLLLMALFSVLLLIFVRGGAYFWPTPVYEVAFINQATGKLARGYAQVHSRYQEEDGEVWWLYYSHKSSPYGSQARVERKDVQFIEEAENAGQITVKDGRIVLGEPLFLQAQQHTLPLAQYQQLQQQVAVLSEKIELIRAQQLAVIHQQLADLDTRKVAYDAPARQRLNDAFRKWQAKIEVLERERAGYQMMVRLADSSEVQLSLSDIADVTYTGKLNYLEKWQVVLGQIWEFLTQSPKQANTAGGVFPALFGTVLMVFLMTIIVTPFGVLAAVYLNEYAPNNALTAVIRISVSNMAGVPSIVYGVFGLGFFVYAVGGNIDAIFFADHLPAPTMGTPGVFWASLTMAILTLPVVIVATEEGLRRVPAGLKSGSYALGATKAETILYTVLPIASPGIMTGVILAIARASGEVAPLMLVGAVKFAPNLPVDGEFPYLHLDRQFMHLGVLIYDGAFHSQTDAKGASMMFAACLLLLIVVFVLNILAVLLRTRLRRRYLQG